MQSDTNFSALLFFLFTFKFSSLKQESQSSETFHIIKVKIKEYKLFKSWLKVNKLTKLNS